MKNTCPFYIVFQVFNIDLIKILRQSNQISYFLLFFIFYISRYIIFHKFLELHSILSAKKIFVTDFLFNGFTQNPHPLNGQNLLSVTKFCCRCSRKIYNKQKNLYVETAKVNSKDVVKGSNFVHSEQFPPVFRF